MLKADTSFNLCDTYFILIFETDTEEGCLYFHSCKLTELQFRSATMCLQTSCCFHDQWLWQILSNSDLHDTDFPFMWFECIIKFKSYCFVIFLKLPVPRQGLAGNVEWLTMWPSSFQVSRCLWRGLKQIVLPSPAYLFPAVLLEFLDDRWACSSWENKD